MPHGHRLSPVAVAVAAGVGLAGTLAGCAQYTDTSPPTGEGQRLALVYLVVLLVPTLLLAGLLAWYHLYDRGTGPRRPPGTVAVAGAWCFLAAAVVAWPAGWVIAVFTKEAMGESKTRGDERAFLDFGWLGVVVGVVSLCLAMMVVTLGLAVLRGQKWAQWTTLVLSSLAFAGGLMGTVTTPGSDGNGLVVSLFLTVLAPVAIPFLMWWDAEEVFARREWISPAPAAPPPSEPEPVAQDRTLTDRWHSRG